MKYEPWRYTCPNGHNSWVANAGDGYRCKNCGVKFDRLRDLKREDIERPPNTGGHGKPTADTEVQA